MKIVSLDSQYKFTQAFILLFRNNSLFIFTQMNTYVCVNETFVGTLQLFLRIL